MLTLPLRLLVFIVVNFLLLPINLRRWLRRRPEWLTVKLEGHVAERPARRRFLRRSRGVSVASLNELARRLVGDRRVRGVVLEIESLDVGWARLDSLRAAVSAIRRSGHRVVAHLSSPGNRELYVALACDEVLCDESGPVSLVGLMLERGFYGEALRRLGIDPEIDRIGAYKSFAETFTHGEMSAENRAALDAILDALSERLIAAIAEGRKLDPARARELVDGGPYLASQARAAGLLDGVLYRDEVPARLGGGKPARMLEADRYLASRPRWIGLALRRRRTIAVLTLEGAIVPGEGTSFPQQALGADAAGRALGDLREDGSVAAVVLHVDSRGGSSAASDRIWRDVVRLGEKKPVIAFLGDVAASGGYYIVAPCALIVAQPSTLTGSIGVVAGKLSLERLLARLGVGTTVLTRGRAAAMGSFRRGFDEEERSRLRAEIAGVYGQFVDKVAAGRKLGREAVDAVGQGRVWLGEAAATRGLVDRTGSLADAIAVAEERARRRPRERFVTRDAAPRPRRTSLLRSLAGATVWDALGSWRALARERVVLFAVDLPDVH
ncbi:MAG: signal peptide peptidase SppA [Myxococcales bacterium]|nr:signal peptide peptidase SppA [Myxococcales bacterium]